jgi:arylsulfatase A-like enzyme
MFPRGRALVFALLAGALAFGILVRTRLQLGSPLPSDQPVPWLLLGFLQDASVLAIAGAVALIASRGRWSRAVAEAALGLFILLHAAALFLWSEAILYFGHPPRREDLAIAASASFWRFTADASGALHAGIALAALLALCLLAAAILGRSRMEWISARRLLAAGLLLLVVCALAPRVSLAATARSPAYAVVDLLGQKRAPSSRAASHAARPLLPELSARALVPAGSVARFVDDAYPLAYWPAARSAAAPRLPAGVRPNVVFVVMEGVRDHEVGAYGGTVPGLTPNLDRLAREGIRFQDVWSPGTHTPEGELALWYGLLAVPHEIVLTLHPDLPLTGLPEILRRAGWKSFLWIHNSDQTFFGEDRFFRPRGFRTIDGRDFDPSEPRTNWGFSDRALARRTAAALDRMEEPFAAMMLTISNHHPYQVPADARTDVTIDAPAEAVHVRIPGWRALVGRRTVPMLRTIHYTDEAVGEFFKLIASRAWFSRTLFVVTSDHGLPIAPLGGVSSPHRFARLRHGIPWILYSPLLAGGRVVAGPSSLADVPATLLGLMGIESARAGAGCDRLDPTACSSDRPVIAWNDEGQMLTIATSGRVYHATVSSEEAPGDGSLSEELLVDPAADPDGLRNLASVEAGTTAALRHLARVCLEVYPWLVTRGRSGVPARALAAVPERGQDLASRVFAPLPPAGRRRLRGP